jgi:hypothetical protein
MNTSTKETGKKHAIDSSSDTTDTTANNSKKFKTEDIFTEEFLLKLLKDNKINELVESMSKIKDLVLHTKVYEKLNIFLSNSKDNMDKFVAANGIKNVVTTMNNYLAIGLCENLVIQACYILMNFVYHHKTSLFLLLDGAIKTIISAMNVHTRKGYLESQNETVHMTRTTVLDVICNTLDYFRLIDDNIYGKQIINDGGISILTNIVKTHKQNLLLTSNILKTLSSLIIYSDVHKINNYTKDVIEDVIEPVIEAMLMVNNINKKQFKIKGHDTLVLIYGYKILKILFAHKNIAIKLASKTEFVSNIYDMINKNVIHNHVMNSALPVLLKLFDASEIQKKHEYATFYHKLCNTYIQDNNQDSIYYSCEFLKILSAFITNERQNIALAYIDMLQEPIKRYINNDRILLEAVLTIKNCIKINSSSQMYQTGVIGVLLNVIKKHMNNAKLNNSAYLAIFSLLKQSSNFEAIDNFVASGGIKTVVTSMKTFSAKNEPGDELNVICNVLSILCNSVTNYALIIALDGFKELLTIIKKYIKHKSAPAYLEVLKRIYCSPHSRINHYVVSFDDIKTIVEVMIEHNDNPNVQFFGCEIQRVWTLKDIPVTCLALADFGRIRMFDKLNPNYKTIADASGFNAVICAMVKHENNVHLQYSAFSMFINYVKRVGRSAIEQVMTELDLLIKNMNKHIDNVHVRFYACALLGLLCQDFDIEKVPQITIIKENQTAIIKKECIKYAITTLEKEIEKSNKIINPCFLLFNITRNNTDDNSIKDFFGCNIMDTILSVIKKNRNDVRNLKSATDLLCLLIQYNDGPDKFAMAGGIGLILDIMITLKKEKDLIINILTMLFKVSQVENYLLNIVSTCGISLLLTTMQEIVEDNDDNILFNVCKIMNNLVKVVQIKDAMKELKVSEWATKVKENRCNTDIEQLLDTLIKLE